MPRSQARATWARERPVSPAILSRALTIRSTRSPVRPRPEASPVWFWYLAPLAFPEWYLPLSTPPERRPRNEPELECFCHRDQFPFYRRCTREYSICSPTKRDQPRNSASVFACAIHHAGVSDTPI